MPDIEYAFLADAADVQPGSKFHVLGGGVSRLTGPSFPFVHPHMSLVVGLRLGAGERNHEYDMGFLVTGPDGAQVANATGKVVARGTGDASDTIITLAVDLWNMTLKLPGEHLVRITVDGSERKRLLLTVGQAGREVAPEPPRYLA
jgi:hypothetical protein